MDQTRRMGFGIEGTFDTPPPSVDLTPYAQARAQFIAEHAQAPNAFLLSPDCYAILHAQAVRVAGYESCRPGIVTPAPPVPSALVWAYALYVVPGLPTGTIKAVLV